MVLPECVLLTPRQLWRPRVSRFGGFAAMVDSRASRIAAVASGLFVVAVGPAEAQFRAAAEVFSGYQLRHAGGSGVVPRGWFVAGGPYAADGLAVIGEVAT